MFDAVSQTTKVTNSETVTSPSATHASAKPALETDRAEKPEKQQHAQQTTLQKLNNEKKISEKKEVSQEFLDDLENDIELIHNIALQFSVHDSTGRTMVKVINKDTEKTIREIPPEKVLDIAAKLDEMLGMLFDKTV
jgi:flagellar protein FlaG